LKIQRGFVRERFEAENRQIFEIHDFDCI
jgi:hypothetical protein